MYNVGKLMIDDDDDDVVVATELGPRASGRPTANSRTNSRSKHVPTLYS